MTVVLYNDLACKLKYATIMNDNIFELCERNYAYGIVLAKYCGTWLLLDNGYLNWGTTIPTMKNTIYRNEIRRSEWLESMQIDVECTFGILKGKFRILNTGIFTWSECF